MTCPVCHQKNIPSLYTNCPNCEANLVSLKMLDALEEQYVETVKGKVSIEGELIQQKKEYEKEISKKNRRISTLWFLLFLIPLGYYFFGRTTPKQVESPIIIQHDSLSLYKENMVQKETEISELKRRMNTLESTRNIRELKYVVKEGDHLYELGKLFYNDTTAWYQIALDNKVYDVRGLPVGDTLLIKYRE